MPFAKAFARLGAAALLTASTAIAASAFDITDMTDAEREAFRAEVRAYIMENPEMIMEEAYEVYQQRQSEAQVANDADLIAKSADVIYDDENDAVYGNPDGDIVLVEFSDYRCGYCKKAYPDVQALLEKDGNIKLIVKEFPILGEASILAGRFAVATKLVAGNEAYLKLHDELMQARGDVSEGSLRRLANGLEIDADAVIAQMESDEVTAILARNYQLAQDLQISGTPAFVLGDQMLRGYLPYDAMVEIVAEVRKNR
ncbi:DsbA family protein [Celeribacter halophilus]|jgi:protein-disulfide isomerase|uniref:Protein-disulfide isomerase n=1 Tax=Celeribacter halophilus TaxID=576117 RepID=A0A1I3P402_9RHOB|nr:DsbA family protein [Celeribacter halophilus]MBU2888577.1 DsbA family protein [Celeribacter halophilus]MDO6509068.1 DsbA family protein [Celeribacter halophilus]PZX14746.1 protein-disulfide isomerase [Celeribacter halophilus]SFJ16161.1 Protein-disulfide isomerase [Celeribacter halophilus]